MKTALDIFVENVKYIHGIDLTVAASKEYNTAKETEKQQIIDAWENGDMIELRRINHYRSGQEYYNENFTE